MMSTKLVTVILSAAALVLGALIFISRDKPVYKLTPQHNLYEIGITCTNGGDPTVEGNFDGMLMVSCGQGGER